MSNSDPALQELISRLSSSSLGAPGGVTHFDMAYKYARDWERAQKKDASALKELDFGVGPQCIRCMKPCIDMSTGKWKPMKCGRCEGVIYCSKDCQVADWKQSLTPRALPHKQLCPRNKEHMAHLPYYRSTFLQFPWARIETDGTCSHDVLRARFGVLGSGPSFGYWSVPGGVRPHDQKQSMIRAAKKTAIEEALASLNERTKEYIHGEVLLGKEWPSDQAAWKIKDTSSAKIIPRLAFDAEHPAPKLPEPGQIKDWKSWYEWRGLSLESPAAQLMDFPLSVYHLLVDILDVIKSDRGPENRQKLIIHYIGAEVELNFLPLFSELALLLPYTDISIVFFGDAVHNLVKIANSVAPESLATKEVVWKYTAPEETGGSTVEIGLFAEGPAWTRYVAAIQMPDVLVGLNAGLLSYATWTEPIFMSAVLNIPFGVTEYAEQSMETCATGLPTMCANYATRFGVDSPYHEPLTRERPHPITPNPFHRPGQRPLPVIRTPNAYNGFSMPVVLKDLNQKSQVSLDEL